MPLVPIVNSLEQWMGSGSFWISGAADVSRYPGMLSFDTMYVHSIGPSRLNTASYAIPTSSLDHAWRIQVKYDEDYPSEVQYTKIILARESGSGWYDET